ncbi:hypothetical protein HAX54_018367 [Datura stramonium]|uniref:Uncharacterized protein n=1 Tax=Datura stramonium TaxID=4076 RepID=A0ABS8UPA0_DATST|nr:hypothetical protein [Datura stramonium]
MSHVAILGMPNESLHDSSSLTLKELLRMSQTYFKTVRERLQEDNFYKRCLALRLVPEGWCRAGGGKPQRGRLVPTGGESKGAALGESRPGRRIKEDALYVLGYLSLVDGF